MIKILIIFNSDQFIMEEKELDIHEEEPIEKITEISVDSESSKTFVFQDEGHTLGNILRTTLMKELRLIL